jgi:hypothetical protein
MYRPFAFLYESAAYFPRMEGIASKGSSFPLPGFSFREYIPAKKAGVTATTKRPE